VTFKTLDFSLGDCMMNAPLPSKDKILLVASRVG
jgi:hypothetical protein